MTAPLSLSAIREQLAGITKLGEWETTRANEIVIYAPNGFGAYRIIAHASDAADAAFIAAAPSTVARLLGALERVEALADESIHRISIEDLRAAITGEGGA